MLGIARGSLAELKTFLTLSERLGLTPIETTDSLLQDYAEINKMLTGLTYPSNPTCRRISSNARYRARL